MEKLSLNLSFSDSLILIPFVFKVMKSRRLLCVVYVEMIREAMNKSTFRILVGKRLENVHLRDIKSGSITSQHKRGQVMNMEHGRN